MALLRLLFRLFVSMVVTLFIVTALLYATVMLTPAETRAALYMPPRTSPRMTEEQLQKMVDLIIEKYHLNDPYPVQYYHWLSGLVKGNWGFSPTLNEDVFSAIVRRAPTTAELTFYSILLYLPLGLISGVIAGSKREKYPDRAFRVVAYIATSLPPFILAIVMMAIFYGTLGWLGPMRTSMSMNSVLSSPEFRQITSFLTIDGALNGRWDVTLDAFKHLIMPATTLAFAHWAILGRITRSRMIEEMQQNYVVAAQARGIPQPRITWRHMLRNTLPPALTSSILSATSLLTGVYVVEIIFNFHGISTIAVRSMDQIPDAPAALGFGIYSVIVVLLLMSILDLLQFFVNPRLAKRQ